MYIVQGQSFFFNTSSSFALSHQLNFTPHHPHELTLYNNLLMKDCDLEIVCEEIFVNSCNISCKMLGWRAWTPSIICFVKNFQKWKHFRINTLQGINRSYSSILVKVHGKIYLADLIFTIYQNYILALTRLIPSHIYFNHTPGNLSDVQVHVTNMMPPPPLNKNVPTSLHARHTNIQSPTELHVAIAWYH